MSQAAVNPADLAAAQEAESQTRTRAFWLSVGLQGFPPDYPVQGTKTAQWLQVGNAIPPPLAKAILAQLVQADEAAA